MSSSLFGGDDGPADAMNDEPELPRATDQSSSSSDEETIKGDRDEDHIADLLEDDQRSNDTSTPAAGPSSIAHRYHELLEAEHESPSEDGSTDAFPRLAASPMGSMLSVPDDPPSVQVCKSTMLKPEVLLTAHAGFCDILARK